MEKRLLLLAPAPEMELPVTRIGGLPVAPAGFSWPACAECQRSMQFLAQVALADAGLAADRLLLMFMCAEPCWGGHPYAGANAAICVSIEGGRPVAPPADAPTGPCHGLRARPFEGDYEQARVQIEPTDFVYGHAGVEAASVSRFIPTCSRCSEPMQFVVQLEQGPDITTAFSFNDTTACAYVCARCLDAATMFVDDFYGSPPPLG